MTVYARSDVASVVLSVAHGGCGKTHTRPAPGGEPIAVWALDCPACETHLRHDPLWGANATSIPETPDETAIRKHNEERTQAEQQAKNVAVMEKLGDLPEALRNLGPDMAQALVSALAAILPVMQQQTAPPPAAQPEPEPEPEDAPPSEDEPVDIETLTMPQLRKLASQHGLPARRSREDMVAMLKEYLAR